METFKGLFSEPVKRVSGETEFPKWVPLHEKHIVRGNPFDMWVDGVKVYGAAPATLTEILSKHDWKSISIERNEAIKAPGWTPVVGRDGSVTVEVHDEAEEHKALGLDTED